MSSSDLSLLLNTVHKEQLIDYLKFFRKCQTDCVKEINCLFDEQYEMRLLEDMYSLEDVKNILESLKTLITSNLSDELNTYTNQSILFIQQLMLQAEANNINLAIDTHILDDKLLLNNIDKLEIEMKSSNSNVSDKSKLAKISGI
jgi:hypothetical protein